jgi:hypothetical protein
MAPSGTRYLNAMPSARMPCPIQRPRRGAHRAAPLRGALPSRLDVGEMSSMSEGSRTISTAAPNSVKASTSGVKKLPSVWMRSSRKISPERYPLPKTTGS